jgi:hypothetical protein
MCGWSNIHRDSGGTKVFRDFRQYCPIKCSDIALKYVACFEKGKTYTFLFGSLCLFHDTALSAFLVINTLDNATSDVYFVYKTALIGGPGSSVSIATDYRLDGPEIESRWGEIFRTRLDQSSGPPSLL